MNTVRTIIGDMAKLARKRSPDRSVSFAKYYDDPVAFAREVLGVEPWSTQVEILQALQGHEKVTVASCNGVGKSTIAAVAALWFYCTRGAGNRVILMASKAKQINDVVFHAIRQQVQGAKVPIPGDLAQLANTGLRADDGRQIMGIAADNPTGLQGVRAREMLLIVDETSGVKDDIMTAAFSLTAGGGKRLLLGNPSSIREPYSTFYKTHKSPDWVKFRISAFDTPNVQAGRIVVPGLIDRAFVTETLDMHGEASAEYRVRILGEFCELSEGQMFSPELLAQAQARYATAKAEGRLIISVDPAGSTGTGDDSGFIALRGDKVLSAYTLRGLSAAQHVAEIRKLVTEHGGSPDDTQVVWDVGGEVGSNLSKALQPDLNAKHYASYPIDFSNAPRNKKDYSDLRAEAYHILLARFESGLAIPNNDRLVNELTAFTSEVDSYKQARVSDKKELRKVLHGKSPDLADALVMAVYARAPWRPSKPKTVGPQRVGQGSHGYSAHDPFRIPVGKKNPFGY
jgi:phage terminase large subunit